GLGKTRGVSHNPARLRLCRGSARRPECGYRDGSGLHRKTGAVAFSIKTSVLGAEIRLGQVRWHLRRVLARQAREIAISDHRLGEGGQQPVVENLARQEV